MKKIILTSKGLNSKKGRLVIKRALVECIGKKYREYFADKSIIMFVMSDYEINDIIINAALEIGFKRENIDIWDEKALLKKDKYRSRYSVCYVSEGNTFELMHMLRLTGGSELIIESMSEGAMYIGSSAGAAIATSSILLARDFNRYYVDLDDFDGLNLLPESLGNYTVIPHFTKKQLETWKKDTSVYWLDQFDKIEHIPNTKYKVF